MDVLALHARSLDQWMDRVRALSPDQLGFPTPCSEWDVRALVNHVVGEDRWTAPLVEGRTIEEVGGALDGDLLGDDPRGAAEEAAKAAAAAFTEEGALDRTVHLSFGDFPAEGYAWQLVADHLIHAWDLAAATGADRRLDDELVAAVADWFTATEDAYRAGGAIAQRPPVTGDTPQDRLLVAFGRDPLWGA